MWLFVSRCVYEIPRFLSLLVHVLTCIASMVERLGVLVFGCVARCNG